MILLTSATHVGATNMQNESAIYNTLFNIEKKLQKSTEQSQHIMQSPISNEAEVNIGIPVGELLFLSTYLRKYYLGELIAIKSEHGAWLELNSLFEQLNFAIEVDNEALIAQGWFISANNEFKLDLNSKNAFINGVVYPLQDSDFYVDAGDIFIAFEQLNIWFALNAQLNFSSLEFNLKPSIPLPLELKLKREQRLVSSTINSKPTLPWKASPYQSASAPVADLQLNYSASNSNSALNYSILGSQDLAYVKTEYYLAGREGDLITDARLLFSKEDANAELLGPLKATNVQFGDVLATPIGNNFLSTFARGVKINNRPLYSQVNTNQITLTGAIHAGWDVELYRNKILIDQQLSLPEGRYLFENIDLLYGANTFELIFYGPQGQVERKVEEYLVNGNSLEAGQDFYEMSVTEQGEQLLNNSSYKSAKDGWQFSGRYERGISDYISVYTGLSALNNDDGANESTYALGSNISIFDKVLVNIDYEQSSNDEKELEIALRSELAGQSLRFSIQDETRRLNSNQQNNLLNSAKIYEFYIAGRTPDIGYGSFSYQNTATHLQSNLFEDQFRLGNIFNYTIGGYSFNNNLQWSDNDLFYGSSRLQKRFGRVSTRFGVNYTFKPEREITSYEAQFSRTLTSSLQGELTLRHQLQNNITLAELDLNWQADLFSLNSYFNVDTDDNWRVGLFSRVSLGFDTVNKGYFINKRSLVNSGSLMVHVYLDENNNGVFDKGDKNIEGVKVKGLQNYRRADTDENGMALLSGMPANLTTDIIIDSESLPDPFYVTANDGFSFTPRAGFVEYMDIALNNSSEIEGTVYKQGAETNDVAAYATIKLFDESGSKVAQTQAAYDGYYLFTDLRPGKYKAVIDGQFKNRKSLKNTQQVLVNLPARGDVVAGVNFILTEKQKTQGYIANIGSFSSLSILKTYYQLIKRNILKDAQQAPFYVKDEESARYILALGYAKTELSQLKSMCETMQTKGLECSVQEQKISH